MNWRDSIITTIVIMIPFTVFILWYQDTYRNATEDFQNLYFAIGAGVAASILHFVKNHESIKNKKSNQMTIDSLELLLIVMTPTTVSFTILKKAFPQDIYPLLIIFGVVITLWYFATMIRSSRKQDKIDGNPIFFLSNFLYWSFISILVLGAALSIAFK